jgi:hypothetical protein
LTLTTRRSAIMPPCGRKTTAPGGTAASLQAEGSSACASGEADPPRGYGPRLPQNGDVELMLSRLPPARWDLGETTRRLNCTP